MKLIVVEWDLLSISETKVYLDWDCLANGHYNIGVFLSIPFLVFELKFKELREIDEYDSQINLSKRFT